VPLLAVLIEDEVDDLGLLIDALNQIVELTRGRAVPPTSPLPRTRRLDD